MNGNVWQWTADWYDKDYYKKSPAKDPTGPSSGVAPVLRGGSWHWVVSDLRAARRLGRDAPSRRFNNLGFRVVLLPDVPR
jgi:formylglycine-generating enzyme required for sulfatase activity